MFLFRRILKSVHINKWYVFMWTNIKSVHLKSVHIRK